MNILIKPVSSLCNMKCNYCFYHDESKNREFYFKGIMNDDTINNIIEKALEFSQNYINFAFQGGEPTLAGINYFKKFINKVKEKNIGNKKISYSIQTNGLLIDKEWAKFLKENNFLVWKELRKWKNITLQ